MQPASPSVKRCAVICCLLATLAGFGAIGTVKADNSQTVNCESEGMEVSDPSMRGPTCQQAVIAGTNTRTTLTVLVANSSGSVIIVRRFKAGFRTYIPGASAQEWLSKDTVFGQVQGLSRRGVLSGYETASFRGTLSGGGASALSCFTFVRNEGNPQGELSGAVGSLIVVEGSYCKATPSDLSDGEIRAVLAAIHVRTN
jgi:hypothetical protein